MKKTFQTYIIERFLNTDQIEEFLQTYNSSRIKSGREKRVISELDKEIYRKYKGGELLQKLVEEYGRSYWWIWKSIKLAAEHFRAHPNESMDAAQQNS